MKRKKVSPVILCLFLLLLTFCSIAPTARSNDFSSLPAAYNVIGVEDYNYSLALRFFKRYGNFNLENEKLGFYLLGCDMVSHAEDKVVFEPRNSTNFGAKMVFIAPEAGRKTGSFETRDFAGYRNSTLRIKSLTQLVFTKDGNGKWKLTIKGENGNDPELYLEGKKGWNEQLKYTGGSGDFVMDLENYTLSRPGTTFVTYHNFPSSSPLYKIGLKNITFTSEEIMFRTFETRLSKAVEANGSGFRIVVDRKPSSAIIGTIIRFTGDSDDGDNLATVVGIDSNNTVYINAYDSVSFNLHDKGTWLRCFSDMGHGQVYVNEYPRVNLPPTFWSLTNSQINSMLKIVTGVDVTGALDYLTVNLADEDRFGYRLADVTFSRDGLNFTGGMKGAFDVNFDLKFFGRSVTVGPAHIDYASMGNGLLDEVLRINTYKREAFRFYFNPKMLESYCDWGDLPNPPGVFPLTFRIYLDKNFELLGGNMRLKLKKGLVLPGGLIKVTNIGGGYTYPATFEVNTIFTSIGDEFGITFWNADVVAVLSLDRAYITMDGRIWVWGKKFEVGDVNATIAWSYYRGKRFKGIEFSGETGVGKKHVSMVLTCKFKYKKYKKSNGKIKTYIGVKGRGDVKAFGAKFYGIGIGGTSRKFYAFCKLPWPIGRKKATLYFKDITFTKAALDKSDVPMSGSDSGVASFTNDDGLLFVLMPEARRIPQMTLKSGVINTTLNLPDPADEAAITINYQGSMDSISVTLPNNETREVIILTEDAASEDPTKLYGLSYPLDDTENQVYIRIKNAAAGNYTINCTTDTVTDTAIYEVAQIPTIDDSGVIAANTNGVVDLNWNLEQAVTGDVRYHLSLVTMENGEITARYPIYENINVDTDNDGINDSETEVYVDSDALSIAGTTVSTKVTLPDNLVSGTYAFVVEPVLNRTDEDDLQGEAVISNSFTHTNTTYGTVVTAPVGVTVENTGNGITRVKWEKGSTLPYSWDIVVRDASGTRIGATSILSQDLAYGKNLYLDPLSGKDYVYSNLARESNSLASVLMPEVVYDTDYSFEVTAVQRIGPGTSGPYWNGTTIDMNNIEQDLNEGYLVYKAAASEVTGRFVEAQKLKFQIEIYDADKDRPIVSANLFEENVGEIGYSYDIDADVDVEYMRQIDPGALVVNTNVMDSLQLLPDGTVDRFGIVLLSPSGTELLNIPSLSLSNLTTPATLFPPSSAWPALLAEIQKNYPDLAADSAALSRLEQIYLSGAITLVNGNRIRVDLAKLQASGLIFPFESGRYTVSLESYNPRKDLTKTNFAITIRDITPAPFIERIVPRNAGNLATIYGFAEGASSITLNGTTVPVIDGMFEATVTIDSATISFEVTDLFGNQYSGELSFGEYQDMFTWFRQEAHRPFWPMIMPAIQRKNGL